MRILIIAPSDVFAQEEDAEILRMYGYDVLTYHKLHTASYVYNGGNIPSERVVRMHLALEVIDGRIPVIHPTASAELSKTVAGICKTFSAPLWRMEEVPVKPPVSRELIDSLNVADDYFTLVEKQSSAAVKPLTRAVLLRERWTVYRKRLFRWEQRFNARYGRLLKNPQSLKAQQSAPRTVRPYIVPNTVTTTG